MSKSKQIQAEKLHLLNVGIRNAMVEHPAELSPQEVTGVGFNVGQSTAVNLEERLLQLEMNFDLETQVKDGLPKAKGQFLLFFLFKVDDLEDWISQEGDSNLIDAMLGGTLAGIAYSTARGILLTRFQGTIFQGFLLPVINPMRLLDEPFAPTVPDGDG